MQLRRVNKDRKGGNAEGQRGAPCSQTSHRPSTVPQQRTCSVNVLSGYVTELTHYLGVS